ncbi:MAG: hypothetical protein V2A65_03325 [Candidatus Omnitrophota bacterium]
MKDKLPLKILIQKDRFKAATSLEILGGESRNIRQDLAYIEKDYSLLIKSIQEVIAVATQNRRVDPRLYWLVGDNIVRFLERIDNLGFYLVQQTSVLARSVATSESFLQTLISFRLRFSNIFLVNPAIPWTKYKENKVPVPEKVTSNG